MIYYMIFAAKLLFFFEMSKFFVKKEASNEWTLHFCLNKLLITQ